MRVTGFVPAVRGPASIDHGPDTLRACSDLVDVNCAEHLKPDVAVGGWTKMRRMAGDMAAAMLRPSCRGVRRSTRCQL
ncbi:MULTISPECIES: hypothetical protein [Burkholderia]|uniref:hypothetical protein n=1 Tax=Burkholderia TaxID=32008 RepID=UPI000A90419C|nr:MULTISPECIES: hypothetical protein [Burkholderia]